MPPGSPLVVALPAHPGASEDVGWLLQAPECGFPAAADPWRSRLAGARQGGPSQRKWQGAELGMGQQPPFALQPAGSQLSNDSQKSPKERGEGEQYVCSESSKKKSKRMGRHVRVGGQERGAMMFIHI